jgi:methionine-rich copper-binding protein CopC
MTLFRSSKRRGLTLKKTLIIAAVVATLLGPTLAVGAPAFANQTIAQSSMMSESGIKAAMDKLHDQMSSMKMSGDTDKDYMATMKILMGAMKSVNAAEMKDGKDPAMMKHAKDASNAFKTETFGGFGV